MRNGTPKIAALSRTLATLEAVVSGGRARSASEVARELSVPVQTVHRQITTLVAEGYLARVGHGLHVAGPRLRRLLQAIDQNEVIAQAAAPILDRLARRARSIAQLGTLEQDMVTYRIKAGRRADDLLTKVGMQLEAYCSAIGKVLLAHLPEADREAYLANGPFIALTPSTITDPAALRGELDAIRAAGFARDDGEVVEGLYCLAVPIRTGDGGAPAAAISISRSDPRTVRASADEIVGMLKEAALEIEHAIG